jgi:hypothetical protein
MLKLKQHGVQIYYLEPITVLQGGHPLYMRYTGLSDDDNVEVKVHSNATGDER